jgi:endonuclease YncB( thermonuclease family)
MAARGILEAPCLLHPAVLWPAGSCDADTLRVELAGPLRFRAPGRPSRRWRGRAGEVMVVRLEDVDAPELHAPAIVPAGGHRQRQHGAERAVLELARRLGQARAPVRARFTTRLDDPTDALDCYGRLVGTLRVLVRGRWVDLNLWLLRRGHALPCFYTSSEPAAVARALAAAGEARRARRGVWRWLERDVRRFRGLPARAEPERGSDAGPLCWPKIFRRQCSLLARAGELGRERPRLDGRALLAALGESEERAVAREAWLRERAGGEVAPRFGWREMVDGRGELGVGPGDVVWEEK